MVDALMSCSACPLDVHVAESTRNTFMTIETDSWRHMQGTVSCPMSTTRLGPQPVVRSRETYSSVRFPLTQSGITRRYFRQHAGRGRLSPSRPTISPFHATSASTLSSFSPSAQHHLHARAITVLAEHTSVGMPPEWNAHLLHGVQITDSSLCALCPRTNRAKERASPRLPQIPRTVDTCSNHRIRTTCACIAFRPDYLISR